MKILIRKILRRFKKRHMWRDIEYFDDAWEIRVAEMAAWIVPGRSVLDLGCGKMYLEKYLEKNPYFPVDYVKRRDDCIVCDLNQKQYPNIKTDITFISGCLEYIRPYEWLINTACQHSSRVILSYCAIAEFPDIKKRKALAWVNHLSTDELAQFFIKNNFQLTDQFMTSEKNHIFIFDHK